MHFFSGSGGGLLADILVGHRVVCAVEINQYCQQVLSARQADGMLEWFPIFGDVTTFCGSPWNGLIELISGGFPCTDVSSAGKRAGIDGEHSGLWRDFARIISEVEPQEVFIENSPLLRTSGLVRILQNLASMGYHACWGVLGAKALGAPHLRKRMWIYAIRGDVADAHSVERRRHLQQRVSEADSFGDERLSGQDVVDPYNNGQREFFLHAEMASSSETSGDASIFPNHSDSNVPGLKIGQGCRSNSQSEQSTTERVSRQT